MAEQSGIVRIKGKIGNLSFYQGNNKDLVKTATGPSKERIMTDPKYIRTRENLSEFGGSAHIGKAFRTGLSETINVMKGKYMAGRVTGMFKRVCNNGSGIRGERTFEIVPNTFIFTGFNFNKSKILSSIFSPPYSYTANVGRNETVLLIPDFNISDYVYAPTGATHFRLANSTSILSNYLYSTTHKKYNPTDPTIDGLNIVQYSGYIPVSGMVGSTTTITSTIVGAPIMTLTAGLMGCIGIEFFQFVNGNYYLLNAENAMRIDNVF